MVDMVYNGTEYLLTFYNPNGNQRGQNRVNGGWAQQCNWDNIIGDKQENGAGYPVELPSRFIQLYTLNNEIAFDPFLGNGTTLIASEQNQRICYGTELEPIYIDVILKRFNKTFPDSQFRCLNREFNFEKLFIE